jgi:hypothetical protein
LPSAFTEGSAHSGRPGALAGGALSRSVAFDRRGRAPARPNFRATPAPPASEPAVPAGRENARGSGALGGGVQLFRRRERSALPTLRTRAGEHRVRTPEFVGFQRWVVRRDDLTTTWEEFKEANYRPERVRREPAPLPNLEQAPIPIFSTRFRALPHATRARIKGV